MAGKSTQEKNLMDALDKYGLVRDIRYETFSYPISGRALGIPVPESIQEGKERHYIGMTVVRLYEKGVYAAKKEAAKKGSHFNIEGYVSEGRAYCSEVEPHFSRKAGRIRATGRALQNFLATLA